MQPIEDYRAFADRWLRWACGGSGGRDEFDAVYRQITENRDTPGAKRGDPGWYSSCGDLPMALLEACGVRFPWINRKSLGQYKVGMNVSRLAWAPMSRDPRSTDIYRTGDTLITWERPDTKDAHVMVTLNEPQGTRAIVIAEYGQPGAHVRSKGISKLAGSVSVGGKRVRRVLMLEDVLKAAAAANELEPVRLDTDTDRAPPPSEPITLAPPVDPETLPRLEKGDGVRQKPHLRDAVRLMQERLNATGTKPALTVDGDFWNKSEAALIAFQKARMLKPDGICYRLSWRELLRDVVAF